MYHSLHTFGLSYSQVLSIVYANKLQLGSQISLTIQKVSKIVNPCDRAFFVRTLCREEVEIRTLYPYPRICILLLCKIFRRLIIYCLYSRSYIWGDIFPIGATLYRLLTDKKINYFYHSNGIVIVLSSNKWNIHICHFQLYRRGNVWVIRFQINN